MKLTGLFVLSLGLTLGLAFAESAPAYDEATRTGTVWAKGVSEESGWYDADKSRTKEDADDQMCYAASAANLIAWWQNSDSAVASDAPKDVDDIWNTFVSNNLLWEVGGTAHATINWWLSGVYSPVNDAATDWADDNDPVWNRFYATPEESYAVDESGKKSDILPLTLPNYNPDDSASFGGYYYDQYGLSQQDLSEFMVWVWGGSHPESKGAETGSVHETLTLGDIGESDNNDGASEDEGDVDYMYELDFVEILEDAPLSLAVYFDTPAHGHALTLWGVEFKDGELVGIWLTDSDDYTGDDRLFYEPVVVDEDANLIYFGEKKDGRYQSIEYEGHTVYIHTIYSIDPSSTANWRLVPEPATATLSLLALAALAVRRRR